MFTEGNSGKSPNECRWSSYDEDTQFVNGTTHGNMSDEMFHSSSGFGTANGVRSSEDSTEAGERIKPTAGQEDGGGSSSSPSGEKPSAPDHHQVSPRQYQNWNSEGHQHSDRPEYPDAGYPVTEKVQVDTNGTSASEITVTFSPGRENSGGAAPGIHADDGKKESAPYNNDRDNGCAEGNGEPVTNGNIYNIVVPASGHSDLAYNTLVPGTEGKKNEDYDSMGGYGDDGNSDSLGKGSLLRTMLITSVVVILALGIAGMAVFLIVTYGLDDPGVKKAAGLNGDNTFDDYNGSSAQPAERFGNRDSQLTTAGSEDTTPTTNPRTTPTVPTTTRFKKMPRGFMMGRPQPPQDSPVNSAGSEDTTPTTSPRTPATVPTTTRFRKMPRGFMMGRPQPPQDSRVNSADSEATTPTTSPRTPATVPTTTRFLKMPRGFMMGRPQPPQAKTTTIGEAETTTRSVTTSLSVKSKSTIKPENSKIDMTWLRKPMRPPAPPAKTTKIGEAETTTRSVTTPLSVKSKSTIKPENSKIDMAWLRKPMRPPPPPDSATSAPGANVTSGVLDSSTEGIPK